MRPHSFFLLNFGCAKNQVEGEHIAGLLISAGLAPQAGPEEAGLLVVNTCGFLQEAVEENLDAILELADAKGAGQRLAVVGCLVGRYGKKLAAQLPEVDLFVAPGEVPGLVAHLAAPPPSRLAISRPLGIMGAEHPRALSSGPGWAYLRLADGCGHRCGFCTIPAIRGPLRSRSAEDILAEAKSLAANGVLELNLVAQDLLSWGKDFSPAASLPQLLSDLAAIEEVAWLRLLYLHPGGLSGGLLDELAGVPKLVPYFDVPFQHAHPKVLAAMRRKGGPEEFLGLVDRIRSLFPAAWLRTTMLVGHPGEGEAEFRALMEFTARASFDHLGAFAFSPEPGTRSARMEAPPAQAAQERREILMAAQKPVSAARLAGLLGGELPVLCLGAHPDSDLVGAARWAGAAPEVDGLVIITDGPMRPGQIQTCRVTASHDYDLEGIIAD